MFVFHYVAGHWCCMWSMPVMQSSATALYTVARYPTTATPNSNESCSIRIHDVAASTSREVIMTWIAFNVDLLALRHSIG